MSLILSTVLPTVLAIIAYFVKNELLDPIHWFNEIRWRIAAALTYHADYLLNVNNDDAKIAMRQLAADLEVAYKRIPRTGILVRFSILVSGDQVGDAFGGLLRISNRPSGIENEEDFKLVRSQLKLH